MNHQDLINTCIFEQIQGLLFSDLSGPLKITRTRNKIQLVTLMISRYLHMIACFISILYLNSELKVIFLN